MEPRFYDVLARTQEKHWWYAARREILAWAVERALDGAPKHGVIYDLGCGVGANLPMLSSYGEVIGVDASEVAIDHCRSRGLENVRRADLENLGGLPDASARAVILADVIEHLDDDAGCLAAAHRLLAPGGGLVVTVPAFQILWGPNDDISQHRRRYTERSLRRVVEPLYTIERTSYFNSWLLPPIALGRWIQRVRQSEASAEGELPARVTNSVLRRIFRSELSVLKRGGRFPAGVSLLCVARRR